MSESWYLLNGTFFTTARTYMYMCYKKIEMNKHFFEIFLSYICNHGNKIFDKKLVFQSIFDRFQCSFYNVFILAFNSQV